MEWSIEVSPRKVFLVLCTVILGLVVASTLTGAAWFFLDPGEWAFPLVQMFWVDSELNVPTLFSVVILLISGFLLGVIARMKYRQGAPYARHWAAMAIIFIVLGFDEGAAIHERTVEPVRMLLVLTPLPTGTFLEEGPAWVVLGALFVLGFVLAYVGFLLHLPSRIRNLMILAGAVFVTGALGVEILSHMHALQYSQETATYAALATIEESLEMLGISIFIYTLLTYLSLTAERIEVQVREP